MAHCLNGNSISRHSLKGGRDMYKNNFIHAFDQNGMATVIPAVKLGLSFVCATSPASAAGMWTK